MITREDYVKKINREKERVTKSVRTHIETCVDGMPIVEEYILDEYEKKYFDKKALDELREEYPFLKFEISFNTIEWGLK